MYLSCGSRGFGSASILFGSGSRVLKTNADPDPDTDPDPETDPDPRLDLRMKKPPNKFCTNIK